MLKSHNLLRPKTLIEVNVILDIGAGIRPINWFTPKAHICVEPHSPYADCLEEAGYWVWRTTALGALSRANHGEFDAIYMLDVIEHMERAEGEEVLALAIALAPKQIVVSSPDGFLHQDWDLWKMGGEHWQTHRSAWTPADFPGWAITQYPDGPPGCLNFVAVSP